MLLTYINTTLSYLNSVYVALLQVSRWTILFLWSMNVFRRINLLCRIFYLRHCIIVSSIPLTNKDIQISKIFFWKLSLVIRRWNSYETHSGGPSYVEFLHRSYCCWDVKVALLIHSGDFYRAQHFCLKVTGCIFLYFMYVNAASF